MHIVSHCVESPDSDIAALFTVHFTADEVGSSGDRFGGRFQNSLGSLAFFTSSIV
jgi:hypothetical protein